jgi:alpha-2-macroglobulin-like protein
MAKRHILTLAFVLVASTSLSAETKPVDHIQIDKPMYRLGETVWYRLHSSDSFAKRKFLLTLEDESGAIRLKKSFSSKKAPAASFYLSAKWPGGTYFIVARENAKGPALHKVPLRVYDLKTPALKLSLKLIGDYYYPGDTVVASVKAEDLKGRAIIGADVRFLARFGPLLVDGVGGQTNGQGRCVVRFKVPAEAQTSGRVAVGLECKAGVAAVAEQVTVSASVAAIDFFPEGGSIVEQGSHRMSVLVRDLNGDPVIAEGRVYNGKACVGTFQSNKRGLALLDFKREKGKSYVLKVDRPTGVKKSFKVPGPTGHKYAMRINRSYKTNEWISVLVNGKKSKKSLMVHFVWNDRIQKSERIKITKDYLPGSANFAVPEYYGIGSIILVEDHKAYARAKFFFGKKEPYEVRLTALEDDKLPGQALKVLVTTLKHGRPASADMAVSIFNRGALDQGRLQMTSLPTRALFQPHLNTLLLDAQDLLKEGSYADLERDAFLMSHTAYGYPKEGIDVAKSGLPSLTVGRVKLQPIPKRPPISAKALKGSVTKARRGRLDKMLERAHFTRGVLPRQASKTQFRRLVKKSVRGKTPGLGKSNRKAPQKEKISWKSLDTRDTLFWQGQVKTGSKGTKVLSFRLSHEVSDLEIAAQGMSGSVAMSSRQTVKAQANFESRAAFPEYTRVGDQIEMTVNIAIKDGRKNQVQLNLVLPRCLTALDKTQLTLSPKKDKLHHRFRFTANAANQGTRMSIVITRGMFQEIRHFDFTVGERELTLTVGTTGLGDGVQSAVIPVPKNAVKGSVKVQSRVVPAVKKVKPIVVSSVESIESILRKPSGCFEQTSSSHYPNLEVLSRLKAEGKDGAVMEKAFDYAHSGYKLLKTFQGSSGGFSLWADSKSPKPHYTAMGLMQMALYARTFEGKGTYEMQKALQYLGKQKLERVYRIYALYAVSEYASYSGEQQGQIFMNKLLKDPLEAETNYERALLANALMNSKVEVQKVQFYKLIELLKKAQKEDGGVASKGHGIMGSAAHALIQETTALVTVAFHKAGLKDHAVKAARFLVKKKQTRGGWWGTQATALCIRAMTHVPVSSVIPLDNEKINPIRLSAAGFRKSWTPDPEKQGPHQFTAPLRDGVKSVQFSMTIPKGHEMEYGFGLSYRVAVPESASNAPFRVKTSMAKTVTVGRTTPINVRITKVIFKNNVSTSASGFGVSKKAKRRRAMPKGQFVASIGIPGGCVIDKLDEVKDDAGCQFVEVKNGAISLYWEEAPEPGSFSISLKAVVAGNYVGAPTVLYPYYESGREAYAAGVGIKILGERYQVSLEEAAAALGK